MAVGKESFENERLTKKLIRKAAIDNLIKIASPHTIFVEEGGKVNPKEFAERLAAEMGKAVNRIPVGEFDSKHDQMIQLKRKVYEFIGDVVL